ncbi:two-component regulator propeller domain-containing protein [Spirosoma fluviale]|uniref:histidine kinase n=1 Tax=Spirosoma fluviale TaxID=1597977 RepID=A0A286FE36_9BACT|nr:two-component regulator propeller domain-containing protein [Spirosoma fluviale]SOD81478.1 PAS domain S-box-containing protein [Spirosoma fluviale]
MPFFLFCLLLIGIWPGRTLQAQSKTGQFSYLTTREGLSQDNVTCILQDRKGFMWFGTQDGLNKFDGYTYTVYRNDPRKVNSLSHNFIHILFEDKQGHLWVGTDDGGLSLFDANTETFTNYKHLTGKTNSLAHNKVMAITQDTQGYLWVGTAGGGLDRFDPQQKTFTHFTHQASNPTSLIDNQVSSVFIDQSGIIWIGTDGSGLDRLDPRSNSFTHFQHDPARPYSLSHNRVTTCLEDSRGRFWVGTEGGGLNLLDRTSGIFTHIRHSTQQPGQLSNNDVMVLAEGNDHTLWIGTQNGGITLLHPSGSFSYYTYQADTNDGLNNGSIYSMYRDPVGTMWVGTYSGGVNKLDALPSKFNLYQRRPQNTNKLSHNNILTVRVDQEGDLWLGTDGGGINVLRKGQSVFKTYQYTGRDASSNPRNFILAIYEDRRKRIWTGSFKGGLTLFNREKGSFEPKGNFSLLSISAILEASNGILWLGTFEGGVIRYDPKTDTSTQFDAHPDQAGQLSYHTITALWEDRSGNIWLGTDGGGINIFHPTTKRFTQYIRDTKNAGSLPNNQVNALFGSKSGQLWIGTNSGLSRFDASTQTFTTFRKVNGLANEVIRGILEDKQGTLWLSTNKGMSSFKPATHTVRNYTASDGLQENSFNRMACFVGKGGQLFFGGVSGLNSFNPDSLRDNRFIPPVYITDFQLFNRSVRVEDPQSVLQKVISETRDITLNYDQSVLSFEFAALNYTLSGKNQYAYKLEGFDADWIPAGTKRTVSYTNLNPGDYVFRVRASNNDGGWNKRGTFVRLHIIPPVWQTGWFKGLSVLLMLCALYCVYRLRVQHIKAQQVYLEGQVRERTSEVVQQRQELQDQALYVELLQAKVDQQAARQELQDSEQRFREMADNVDEIFWIRDLHEPRFLYMNPAYETFSGQSPQTLQEDPLSFLTCIVEDDQVAVRESLLNPEHQSSFRFRIRHWDGRVFWMHARVFLAKNQDGLPIRWVGIATDITMAIEKERILEESLVKERNLNQLKSQFIETASHEFRTPLTVISSSAELVRFYVNRFIPSSSLAPITRHLDVLFTKVGSLNMLIDDTLTLSKIDEGKVRIHLEWVDLVALSREVIQSSFNQSEANEQLVQMEVRGCPVDIQLDRNLLTHVLTNLLSNALKFSTTSPRLILEFKPQEVRLLVCDEGMGIPASELRYLFNKFFRATNVNAIQGTGLGLAICREYVTLQGGRIEVESTEGKGTTFTVTLPLI